MARICSDDCDSAGNVGIGSGDGDSTLYSTPVQECLRDSHGGGEKRTKQEGLCLGSVGRHSESVRRHRHHLVCHQLLLTRPRGVFGPPADVDTAAASAALPDKVRRATAAAASLPAPACAPYVPDCTLPPRGRRAEPPSGPPPGPGFPAARHDTGRTRPTVPPSRTVASTDDGPPSLTTTACTWSQPTPSRSSLTPPHAPTPTSHRLHPPRC
jgi:hypothetical protein